MSGKLGPRRTHGNRATYCDGCRCLECRDAERRYRRRYRQQPEDESPRPYSRPSSDPLPPLDPFPRDPFRMEIDA